MVDQWTGTWTKEKDYATYLKDKWCMYDHLANAIRKSNYDVKTTMENLITAILLNTEGAAEDGEKILTDNPDKAHRTESEVLKVDVIYTSQRCPHCGRIRKENRDHKIHAYHCDKCGFTTNDDRVGAMNIWMLGTLWVSGIENPSFASAKVSEEAAAV